MDKREINKFIKHDEDKLKYSLVPPKPLEELAKVLTYGANKYGVDNWRHAEEPSRFVDALYRHLEAWRAGDKLDKESQISHLSHAMANIVFLIHFDND